MNLDKFLVVAGTPGVHKLVTTRGNGVVIEDRQEGRVRFVPVRQNQLTLLATVGIYVDNADQDTVPLVDVFQKMLDQYDTIPPVDPNTAKSTDFRAYFTAILPEHDQDRVHINDIKKSIKWFNFMKQKGIFEEAKKAAEAKKETSESTETNEEA
jgi:Fe-S-cluster formation regulator IscX/YfhJ